MKSNELSIAEAAKQCGIGKMKFYQLLRDLKILTPENLPYTEYQKKGYLRIHTSKWVHSVRGEMARNKAVVTPAGLEFLTKKVNEYFLKLSKKEYKKCS